MPWPWLVGCCGSRSIRIESPSDSVSSTTPLTRPPPDLLAERRLSGENESVAALPPSIAVPEVQPLVRQWRQALWPQRPGATPWKFPALLAHRCHLVRDLRRLGFEPSGADRQQVLREGLRDMRREAEWMDARGRPDVTHRPRPTAIDEASSLLLSIFEHPTVRRHIVKTTITSLLHTRDEALCHGGSARDSETSLVRWAQQEPLSCKPLILELALACAPVCSSPLRSYVPTLVLARTEHAGLSERLRKRLLLLEFPPIRRRTATEILLGGRLRLLEECDALAAILGVRAPRRLQQRCRRACLFDLHIIAQQPWQAGEHNLWPQDEASHAWLVHRHRMFRLFAKERHALRAELDRIESRLSYQQPEVMERVSAIRQGRCPQ